MKYHLSILTLLLALPLFCWAGDNDDFGIWTEVGVEKKLPANFDIGAEAELRTCDNTSKVERIAVGANVSYKAHKYLKLGIGYSLLEGYNAEKSGKKWFTPNYWTPRHRIYFEMSSGIKWGKWVRFSVRERYQYTHRADQTIERFECEGLDAVTGNYIYDDEPTEKLIDGKDTHLLRSRIKIEMDRKKIKWNPFVSVEVQNKLNEQMHTHKVRTSIGTDYKINKQNTIGVAYIFTSEQPEKELMHAVNIGYSYKF